MNAKRRHRRRRRFEHQLRKIDEQLKHVEPPFQRYSMSGTTTGRLSTSQPNLVSFSRGTPRPIDPAELLLQQLDSALQRPGPNDSLIREDPNGEGYQIFDSKEQRWRELRHGTGEGYAQTLTGNGPVAMALRAYEVHGSGLEGASYDDIEMAYLQEAVEATDEQEMADYAEMQQELLNGP